MRPGVARQLQATSPSRVSCHSVCAPLRQLYAAVVHLYYQAYAVHDVSMSAPPPSPTHRHTTRSSHISTDLGGTQSCLGSSCCHAILVYFDASMFSVGHQQCAADSSSCTLLLVAYLLHRHVLNDQCYDMQEAAQGLGCGWLDARHKVMMNGPTSRAVVLPCRSIRRCHFCWGGPSCGTSWGHVWPTPEASTRACLPRSWNQDGQAEALSSSYQAMQASSSRARPSDIQQS